MQQYRRLMIKEYILREFAGLVEVKAQNLENLSVVSCELLMQGLSNKVGQLAAQAYAGYLIACL